MIRPIVCRTSRLSHCALWDTKSGVSRRSSYRRYTPPATRPCRDAARRSRSCPCVPCAGCGGSAPLALGEVADVDTLRLASAKPVEEHQRNHQSVAAPDGGRGIDAIQQPERLLCRQRQFAVLRMAFAAADPCGDIVVVALSLAEAVKQLEDRNEAVHRIDALAFGLQLLFVLQDVSTLWRTGIDIVRRQPPVPQHDFAPVIPFGGREYVALRNPFGDDFIQVKGRSHSRQVYDKNAGDTKRFFPTANLSHIRFIIISSRSSYRLLVLHHRHSF